MYIFSGAVKIDHILDYKISVGGFKVYNLLFSHSVIKFETRDTKKSPNIWNETYFRRYQKGN